MSHRYNIIDIIVGVGMCAIVFGASLFFFAANGTYQVAIESLPEDTAVASAEPASWLEIPMGYLIVAGLMLVTVFFGDLSLTARSREAKALAEMEHQAAKWVYRIAV